MTFVFLEGGIFGVAGLLFSHGQLFVQAHVRIVTGLEIPWSMHSRLEHVEVEA